MLQKERMTAGEMLNVINDLMDMCFLMLDTLSKSCTKCDGCEGDCPYLETEDPIDLPDYLLNEANIPLNAELCAFPDPDTNTILLMEREPQAEVDKLSPELLYLVTMRGICLDSLEEHLKEGDIIYGK